MKKETIRQRKIGEFIHLLSHTNRLHRVLMEEQISKLGIHCSQHQMLAIIAANKSICQKDIAKKLEISSAAVAVTLNKLESAGLVARNQSYDDARMNHITVTESGTALLKQTKAMFETIDEEFFKDISDEEIETLSGILEKICGNVRSNSKK